jgi:hypothetical protein
MLDSIDDIRNPRLNDQAVRPNPFEDRNNDLFNPRFGLARRRAGGPPPATPEDPGPTLRDDSPPTLK